jgi:hypothetical protein
VKRIDDEFRGGATGRWGIYCLGNDAVIDWLLALFESLVEFAPQMPVFIIPYDERQSRLGAEAARRGFRYFDHPEVELLHRVGRSFYRDDDFAARGFRKLAAFSGPFEHFFFLDSDVLVLAPLQELCAAIEGQGLDVVHFDTDVDQVYRPGRMRSALEASGRGRGFNAGLFAGRRGALDAARMKATLADLGPEWRTDLVPNAEQPFFNLYADRVGLRLAFGHELVPDICSTCWPAVGRLEQGASGWRLRDSGRWDEGWRFQFAHWAGFELSSEMPNRSLWEVYSARARARRAGTPAGQLEAAP